MQSADGQAYLVFNGEIYNYRELMTELEQQRYRFRANLSIEVRLALSQHAGFDDFAEINGILVCALGMVALGDVKEAPPKK